MGNRKNLRYPIPEQRLIQTSSEHLYSSFDAQLTYTTPTAQPMDVFVYDAKGKLLQQVQYQVRKGENTLPLDLTNLDSGVYFVKVVQQDQSLFERVVVQ